jgi:NADH-quinone oxidoreductase subunit L
VHGHLTWKVHLPLIVLAVLSIAGGWIELPPLLGDQPRFSRFLDPVFAEHGTTAAHGEATAIEHGSSAATGHDGDHAAAAHHDTGEEILTMAVAIAASLGGIALAWMMFGRAATSAGVEDRAARVPGVPAGLAGFWLRGWDFDRLYDALVTRPFVGLARAGRGDVADLVPRAIAYLVSGGNAVVRRTQIRQLRWYAAGIAAGAVIVLALVYLA